MALGRNISPGQGEKYYRKDDYYLEREGGEEHKLEWAGKLATELGLSGKANAEEWENALHGRFPGGIEISGGSFKDENGEPQRRAGTDFEFSAPKSVSIQALVHDDGNLIKAHREAVSVAMSELEKHVGARRGHAGREWETTGQGLIGRVTHLTSRAGDPHLHDHVVFLNVTKNRDSSHQAMTNDQMMHYQRLAQEVYHSELSKRLREMGFEIEKGQYGEPQIKGYSREHIEHFSQRADDIERFLQEEFGVTRKEATLEQKQTAWEHTRESKKAREIEGLQKEWQERAQKIGAEKIIPGAQEKSLSPNERLEVARQDLKFAVEHLTERESAVKEGELLRTVLQSGRGKIGIQDIEKAYAEALKNGEIIRQSGDGPKQPLITSIEAFDREKRVLKMEKEGRGAVEPIMNPFQADAAIKRKEIENDMEYSPEQKAAMMLFLTSDNRFIGVNGFAGTGKTTLWKPCIEIAQEAGYQVIGLAPSHAGKDALSDSFERFKKNGFDNVTTIHSWLSSREAGGSLDKRTIVIMDEAGLSSMKMTESAMKRIERSGARGSFSGDIKQNESVEAGPAFRALQNNGMKTEYVKEMQRQKDAPENIREAAKLSVYNQAKALEKLEKNINEIKDPEDRYKAIAEEYVRTADPKDTLVMTGTNLARKMVNDNIREELGLKGQGQEFRAFEAEDKTKAQMKRIDTYQKGQEIRFTKDYESIGVKAGDVRKIESVDLERGTINLSGPNGEPANSVFGTRGIAPGRYSGEGWEIGKTENLELAKGDRIRVTGNSLKNEGITNGMKGEILEASKDRLKVKLDNGKEAFISVGKKPLEVSHGYAQTGHSAQGLGAGKVIMDLPSNSQTVNQRSFYTNLTRTKEDVKIFTDNREKLTGAVERTKDKTMAREVEIGRG